MVLFAAEGLPRPDRVGAIMVLPPLPSHTRTNPKLALPLPTKTLSKPASTQTSAHILQDVRTMRSGREKWVQATLDHSSPPFFDTKQAMAI